MGALEGGSMGGGCMRVGEHRRVGGWGGYMKVGACMRVGAGVGFIIFIRFWATDSIADYFTRCIVICFKSRLE